MQRYFSDSKKDKFYLSSEDSYHIKKVMRLKVGDNVEVVIDKTLYICQIIDTTDLVLVERVKKLEAMVKGEYEIVIAQSILKEQKMDFVLQKSTELGVDEIIPLKTTRSIVKLDSKKDKKQERWMRIVKEASEQSKRLEIPRISRVKTVEELTEEEYDLKILCTVNEKTKSIKSVLKSIKNSQKDVRILLVVGPEGGFTPEEENMMMNDDFVPVSLGSRVLRSETVSLFIMSIMSYELKR